MLYFRFLFTVLATGFFFLKGFASENSFEPHFYKAEIAINNDSLALAENPKFAKKFNALVSRAYFKIIVEAERADIRLVEEYKRMYGAYEANTLNPGSEKKFVKTYKKFLAHRRMLAGLKSWRIFSEYRTGDLDYFKAENYDEILEMYQRGTNEQTMVKVLMYKLADLYHFGE